jgi:UDP-N-acetylmuramate: L-alanyl-gamma-D-glutamyl-meso-diaminopimelate ligase
MKPGERVHLIGIAGAAMAPLAGMLAERGFHVSGSDEKVYPPASTLLASLGIAWQEGYREENLQPAPDRVVVGNAISRGNPELEYALDRGIPYCSLPEVLREVFLPGHTRIVVAGTHGKTTTTAMLAWIFHVAGRRPDFLAGGVIADFGDRSYGLEGGEEFILEGDEYDSAYFDKAPKFLHYRPNLLAVTSLEFDHADIYLDLAAIELQFRRLVNLVPRSGRIVAWGESETVARVVAKAFCPVETYGLAPGCDWLAGDLEFVEGRTCFRAAHRGREAARVRLGLPGRHNVLNALAAIAVARARGIDREAIEAALESFRGPRRRMELRGEAAGVLVVDDFAHHPTAIRETLAAARTRWPGRRLLAAFEPRSNTMCRRELEPDLAAALAGADLALVGPVHRPGRLAEDDRLSPERVIATIRGCGRAAEAFASAEAIAEFLAAQARAGDVVLVMSNGSFDGLCHRLLERLGREKRVSQ